MYKLLIADDEQLERDAIKLIIEENFPGFFEIGEAANGPEVVETALTFKPNLIFLDIKMPGMSGLQAASQINGILPETRIIIVTAYHYFNYAKEALSLGAVDYLTKPAPPELLVATVKRVIANLESEQFKERLAQERERRLKQITRYFEDDLLVLIAYGEIEENAIEEYLAILNLQYQAFLAAAAAIVHQNNPGELVSEIEKRVLKKNLVDWLKKYFQRLGHQAFIRSIGEEILILILLTENLDEYQYRLKGMQIFTELKEVLQKDFQINLGVGIGGPCNSARLLYQAFLQAKYALRYETAPGSITSFGDIQRDQPQSIYPVNLEKRLCQSILQGDQYTSLELLDGLLDWFQEHIFDPKALQQRVYELLLVLTRETVIKTNFTEFNLDTEELHKSIALNDDQEDIRRFARNFLVQKVETINAYKTSRTNALLKMAIEFIEQNYQKDLSLEEVSSFVQISPFYLSKIFKKETGENFIDYLTGIRIRKAKELLTNPVLTIKDICYQVGYKDPNYFARVFKKIVGITPTEYQTQNLK